VFASTFAEPYNAVAFGEAGDQSHHLLWRLHHGELHGSPAAVVLLIGTNDLGAARYLANGNDEEALINEAVSTVSNNILLSVQTIHRISPSTSVLLVGVLPRAGDDSRMRQPSVYSAAIEAVNLHLQEFESVDGRVMFVDCGKGFLLPDGSGIDPKTMPDGLHPSGDGAQVLADCYLSALKEVVES